MANEALTPKGIAAFEFIQRTGAQSVQVRYHDEEQPTVWIVVAGFPNGVYEADAALDPERAVLRMCERLADGGQCTHCNRPTGFDPDTIETMPLNEIFCWWQYDPELKVFRRACEGDYA